MFPHRVEDLKITRLLKIYNDDNTSAAMRRETNPCSIILYTVCEEYRVVANSGRLQTKLDERIDHDHCRYIIDRSYRYRFDI